MYHIFPKGDLEEIVIMGFFHLFYLSKDKLLTGYTVVYSHIQELFKARIITGLIIFDFRIISIKFYNSG